MGFTYHAGKKAVQEAEGVVEEAADILHKGWIGQHISASGEALMKSQQEVFVTSVHPDTGDIWVSALYGRKGFIQYLPPAEGSSDKVLLVVDVNRTNVAADSSAAGSSNSSEGMSWRGDPFLDGVRLPGSAVGMLLMDHALIKRYRIDGRTVTPLAAEQQQMRVSVTCAMGNCPKYVQKKGLVSDEGPRQPNDVVSVSRSEQLTSFQREWITSSDFFILGTAAPGKDGDSYGADASNRGGHPGFVQVSNPKTIIFPDFRGNNIYLSLGNIHAYPRCGLLLINRSNGDMLQITGRAEIQRGDNAGGNGTKSVKVEITEVRQVTAASPLRMKHVAFSEFNPPNPPTAPVVPGGQHGVSRVNGDTPSGRSSSRIAVSVLQVASITPASEGVKHFRFSPVVLDGSTSVPKLAFLPGQYATFGFDPALAASSSRSAAGGGAGQTTDEQALAAPPNLREGVTRSWTITGGHHHGRGELEITVKRKRGGFVSAWMHDSLREGDKVAFRGVGGDFVLPLDLDHRDEKEQRGGRGRETKQQQQQQQQEEEGRGEFLVTAQHHSPKYLFLSAGIGVTPMAAHVRRLKARAEVAGGCTTGSATTRSVGCAGCDETRTSSTEDDDDSEARCERRRERGPGQQQTGRDDRVEQRRGGGQRWSFPSTVMLHASKTEGEVPFLTELQELHDREPDFYLHVTLTQQQQQPDQRGEETAGPASATDPDVERGGDTTVALPRAVVGGERQEAEASATAAGEGGGGRRRGGGGGGGGRGSGRITAELLGRLVPDAAERLVYLCGPEGFQLAIEQILRRAGVPAASIHTEHFYF